MNVIAFAAPYIAPEFHLDKVMMGKVFSIGLAGTMVGGFLFGYLGDRIGRRPSIILATAAFSVLTMAIAFSGSYEQLLALALSRRYRDRRHAAAELGAQHRVRAKALSVRRS